VIPSFMFRGAEVEQDVMACHQSLHGKHAARHPRH
jgi:hypothetical protein